VFFFQRSLENRILICWAALEPVRIAVSLLNQALSLDTVFRNLDTTDIPQAILLLSITVIKLGWKFLRQAVLKVMTILKNG